MFKQINLLSILFILVHLTASAEIIRDFKVTGNDRVSKNTIINFTDLKRGDDISSSDLNRSLKLIYETNFFENAEISINNNIVSINVKEHPIIQKVELRGIKREKTVEEVTQQLILKEKSPFNEFLVKKDLEKIINIFRQSGYYFIKVNVIEEKNDNNTVNLIYDIDRGEKALIKKISFIGDKKIKDRKLRNIITSEETKFWKFLSKGKYVNIDRIELDKRLLKNYYLEKGYYQVNIKDSYTKIKNNTDFSLVYNIDAGEKFYFGNFSIILPDDFDQNKFSGIKEIFNELEGNRYNYKEIKKILDEIDQVALLENYEFINADVTETVILDKINFVIDIKETERFFVNRINIDGNNITEEFFIRNQLIVDEGDPFNLLLYNKSINKIRGTGIFKTVKAEVDEIKGENKKNINITVEEKPTGEITAGAGIGTDGSNIAFGIKENNFAGKGIELDSSIAISEQSIRGLISYTEPNFRYSNRALTSSIQSTVTDKETDYGYKSTLNKIALGTSFEQYKDLFFSPNISIASESLTTTDDASENYKKQEGSYFDAFFNYSLRYDKRNTYFQPTSGFVSSWYQNIPVMSDEAPILNGYDITGYKEVVDNMIVSAGIYTRAINSITGDDVRASKRLYVPKRRLRGFESGKVGPVDGGDFVGGNYVATINTSTTLPYIMESFQNTDLKLFFDIGNVWGVDYSSSIDDSNKIRSSTGVALEIFSPVGPLTFTLSNSLTKASTDRTESFNFQLGTTF